MALVEAARREEHTVGKYKITLLRDPDGRIIGALIEGGRLTRPVYIAYGENVHYKLPKNVKKFLQRHGFHID